MSITVISGPYGTELERRELDGDVHSNPDGYNEACEGVVSDYKDAGVTLPVTNTFGARNELFEDGGGENRFAHAIEENLKIVRGVFGYGGCLVALGPSGDCYESETISGDASVTGDFHSRQLEVVEPLLNGSDGVLFETFNKGADVVGAAKALRESGIKNSYLSFCVNEEGKLRSGESVSSVIRQVQEQVGDVFDGYLFNCAPLAWIRTALESCRKDGVDDKIAGFYANAFNGDPGVLDCCEEFHGIDDAEKTASDVAELVEEFNLRIASGCCGFTPESIGKIVDATNDAGKEVEETFIPNGILKPNVLIAA